MYITTTTTTIIQHKTPTAEPEQNEETVKGRSHQEDNNLEDEELHVRLRQMGWE